MLHDMKTGEPIVRRRGGPDGEPYNITAAMGHVAPCRVKGNTWKCPKGTVETAHLVELSDRNRRTLRLYLQARATGFHFVPEFDEVLADNFSIIDEIYKSWEREQAATAASSTAAIASRSAVSSALSVVAGLRGG